MYRLNELINEFVVEVMDSNTTSNYWLDKRIELETLLTQKTTHNSDYAKCEHKHRTWTGKPLFMLCLSCGEILE